ncbi:MAG: hypothetical protein RLN75_02640 [Longimicrobiales bacterium]
MRGTAASAALIGGLALAAAGAGPLYGQTETLDRVAIAELVLLSALAAAPDTAAEAWESETLERLEAILDGPPLPEPTMPGVMGSRVRAILVRGQRFRRDVTTALADDDPEAAVAEVVRAYLGGGDGTLPGAPKNMDVLYDHRAALAFRSRFPALGGLRWAGTWFGLAATEPLTDLPPGHSRRVGIDTVIHRYRAKLTPGEPPHTYPSELPLAPAVAPGLVWISPEAAMIWDNHSMFVEVTADILSSPDIDDRAAALDAAAEFFTDPDRAVTSQLAWETMALRHGIFFQGGFPLAVMTRSERNPRGHGSHMRSGAPMVVPGMGRRSGGGH